MITLVLSSASLLIWVFLLFGRGWFWRVSTLQDSSGMRALQPSRVVAVIPARDEADVIGDSIRSLLAQQFAGEFHVIVVDDNSSDDTALRAKELAVQVIDGQPLESRWTGKLWALQQGITAAAEYQPDYFLFTDADILHDPWSVSSLVGMAQARKLDLASHMVKLHCANWQEKFTIPAFVFFFFMLYPPSLIAKESSAVAGAAGGCVLIRPEALAKMGGLAAIRGEVIDDCSLARAVKRSGGRLWLGLSAQTRSIRPYRSLAEISRMISRTAFRQLDHSALLLVASVVGLLITYVVPPVLAVAASYFALAACLLILVCFLPMIRFYRLNPIWALALPLTACFYLAATVRSAIHYWSGQGGVWKGRAQDHQ